MNFLKKIIVTILTLESRLILLKYKPFIVAVTGSVGKTSTKDAIYAVLTSPANCRADGTGMCYVRKSEKSMNSDVGLPITIIGVPNAWRKASGWFRNIAQGLKLIIRKTDYPDCLVLEVGADHPGDIQNIARWLRPHIAVITKVSQTPVHVEFFASPEEVFEEKVSLAKAIRSDGTLVLFADDNKVSSIADLVKDKKIKVLSFGVDSGATARGKDMAINYDENKMPTGMTFNLDLVGEVLPITVYGILGKSYVYPLVAAAAVGKARNIPFDSIAKSLNAYEAPKGRSNIIAGVKGSVIIDDTYNSSPDAVVSALHTIKNIEGAGPKIAVLGDMMELGSYSADEHRKIGREVASALGTSGRLVTVGQRSRATADEAVKSGLDVQNVRSFDTSVEAGEYLKSVAKAGDIILIKGSQSIRMEKAVKMVMRDPDQAEKLLVRQEKEWLNKK